MLGVSGAARGDETGACVAAAEKAQGQRDLGQYTSARQALLVCSRESCPGVIQQDCQRWLVEVERSTPTVVISARDAEGRDVGAVRVRVDGALLIERLDGKPMPIDPGEHVFRYEVAGRAPLEEKVIISAGERDRLLRVRLGEGTSGARPAVDPGDRLAPALAPPPLRASGGGRRTAGLVVGGIGVVALGVGAVFGVRALSKNGDAKALCSRAVCTDPEAERLSGEALASGNVANVAIVAGLVARGVGTYLFMTSSSPPGASPKGAAMRLAPLLGRDAGGASVGGSW